MCGRYELHTHPAAIALAFGLAYPPDIHPRYNIAPMQSVPIVRLNAAGERELQQMRWGLVPRWAKDPSIGSKMINTRGESAGTKATFRTAFARHRCLLPADGFYEWMAVDGGRKQPVRVSMRDEGVFALAGLYERWLSPLGEPLDTCTILTTIANALLRPLHERMPVIVPPGDYGRWLDASEANPESMIAPFPAGRMTWVPVSTKVNSVRNDDAACIEPMADTKGAATLDLPLQAPAGEADAPTQTQLF